MMTSILSLLFGRRVNNYRDSRGLARALTGDIDGAKQDFKAYAQAYANSEEHPNADWREDWIRALEADQNPFTPDTWEALRNE